MKSRLLAAIWILGLAAPLYFIDEVDFPFLLLAELALLLIGILALRQDKGFAAVFFSLTLGFLAAGEIYFRLHYFGSDGLSLSRFKPATFSGAYFDLDDSTLTGLKPSDTTMFKGKLFRINQEGFRGRSVSVEKPSGVFRIAVIGASITMGAGVSEEDRFSDRLEALLNSGATPGRRFEVVNFSISGMSIGNVVYVLSRVAARYSPDLYLLEVSAGTFNNGTEPLTVDRPAHFRHRAGLFEAITQHRYRFFSSSFFFVHYLCELRDGYAPIHFDSAVGSDVIRRGLLMATEAAGRTPVVFYSATREGFDASPVRARLHEARLKDVTESLGTPFVDASSLALPALPALNTEPGAESSIIYPGDGHPNARVHRLIADAIYERLKPLIAGAPAPAHF